MIKKNTCRALALSLATVMLFTVGCNKNDDLMSDLQNNNDGSNSGISSGIATTSVDYAIEVGNGGQIKVRDDEIDISQTTGNVYKAEVFQHTDEEIKEWAGSIFDNGEYEIFKAPLAGTMEEAEDLINKCTEEIAAVQAKDTSVVYDRDTVGFFCGYRALVGEAESQIRNNTRGFAGQPTEEGKAYYKNGNFESTQVAMMRGNINGEEWYIADYYDPENYFGNSSHLRMGKMLYADSPQRQFRIGDVCDETTSADNEVDYGDAISQAEKTLVGLGFTDYTADVTYSLEAANMDPENGTVSEIKGAGYVFNFVPDINGCRQAYTDNMTVAVWEGGEEKYPTNQKIISVYVIDAGGVVEIDFGDFKTVGEEVESGVSLISFEDANEAFKTGIVDFWKKDVVIDDIELKYITIDYPEGAAYVPAYIYHGNGTFAGTYQKNRAIAAVNALNGELLVYNLYI